ncbi:MAG: DNA primase [Leptospirales bacterium]
MDSREYKDWLEQVRRASDLVRVAGDRLPLKRRGRVYVGLCPFHEERTPSFHVDPEKQLFYCFGCQAGGDVFRFIEKFERKTFAEAIRLLADQAGISPPEAKGEKSDRKKLCFSIFREAESHFRRALHLTEGESARRYLQETRRLHPGTIDRFGLGWSAPGMLLKHVVPSRRDEWEVFGLLRKGTSGFREFFRDRLMIPIRMEYGPTMAFGGRILSGDGSGPKYLNSPEHPFFRKKEVLFGLDQARPFIEKSRRALVVEGYFDAMALFESGIETVVAPLGTALTDAHLIHLSRLVDEVVILFDGDKAGRNAVARLVDRLVLDSRIPVKAVQLPDGKDPDEWVRQSGPDTILRAVEQAKPVLDFAMDLFEEKVRTASGEDRTDLLETYYDLAKKIPDPQRLDLFLSRGASLFRLNKDLLAQGLFREETRAEELSSAQSPVRPRGSASNRELMERNLVLELVRLWTDGKEPHPATIMRESDFSFIVSERLALFLKNLWEEPDRSAGTTRNLILNEPMLAEFWMQIPEDQDTRTQRLTDLVSRVRRLSRKDRVTV